MYRLNKKKVSQDFGSLRKMANRLNIKKWTIDHIIYNRKTLSFRSDSVREAVNELLAKGYLYYADEAPREQSTTPNPQKER